MKKFLGGFLLVGATIAALVFENTALRETYQSLLQASLGVGSGGLRLEKPALLWINDGLMAVFFLLIALEIKHEVKAGQLRKLSQVMLPAIAAVGGIAVPALIYLGVTRGVSEAAPGWAIPSATDIAFSLAVLGLFASRVPRSLTTFLMTLAVFDDIAAISIIALFYSASLNLTALAVAGALSAGLLVLNRLGVTRLLPYLLVGALLWIAVLKSGIHATIAGVIVGLTIPYGSTDPTERSPVRTLERRLHPWVMLGILPIFAFANAGVSLRGMSLESLATPTALGVGLGLALGKVVGIFPISWLAMRLGWVPRLEGASTAGLLGVSVLAGIGFTMSIFIGSLAFSHAPAQLESMRVGVIFGSLLSALVGGGLLALALPRGNESRAKARVSPVTA
ncbi:MAG: Na+/H+ antiporter NhaA [Myxococcales bacterium]|nr:Na+/H+ antiporter NhaA [Myxococcales bacterium]